jgi:hypothetical protein
MPGMSGIFGWLSDPTALTTNRASSVSREPSALRTSTDQRPVPSSNVAAVTSVSKRQNASMPRLRMTRSKYSRNSGCCEKYSVQWSAGSNE